MQLKSLRIKIYRIWRINDNASAAALVRLKQLELYDKLCGESCCQATSLTAIGWSKATYYRWRKRYEQCGLSGLESGSRQPRRRRPCEWTKQQEQQVLHLRKRFPLWGKRKLWRVLMAHLHVCHPSGGTGRANRRSTRFVVREQSWRLSESTVGRIVARLVRLGRVEPVAFYYGQVKPTRQRQFHHHAKRWRYGMQAKEPGELMQATT